eukprot:TRINITY_DN1784_c0_g1_i1.p1 TRINITY_DN1784_c0_g1~~TRINITY_DN1784_c0_g1_i1.p1  ORF type:complete len:425 (-),score=75.94 TRINITY_DN1784_c0_g1_i1:1060-2334(-)
MDQILIDKSDELLEDARLHVEQDQYKPARDKVQDAIEVRLAVLRKTEDDQLQFRIMVDLTELSEFLDDIELVLQRRHDQEKQQELAKLRSEFVWVYRDSYLDKLPDVILAKIFSSVDTPTLYSLLHTTKSLSHVSKHIIRNDLSDIQFLPEYRGDFSLLMSLPVEMIYMITKKLDIANQSNMLLVCHTVKDIIQTKAFSEARRTIRYRNFVAMREKLQKMTSLEEEAEQFAEDQDSWGSMAKVFTGVGRGVGGPVGLAFMGAGALMSFEQLSGGLISRNVGKLVDTHKRNKVMKKKRNYRMTSCKICGLEFPKSGNVITKFDGTVYCNCCQMAFCQDCCTNTVYIPMRNQKFEVLVCDDCCDLITTLDPKDSEESEESSVSIEEVPSHHVSWQGDHIYSHSSDSSYDSEDYEWDLQQNKSKSEE